MKIRADNIDNHLAELKTEKRASPFQWIDVLETFDSLKLQIDSQADACTAVRYALPKIKEVTEKASNTLAKSQSGRLIYCGAGTSARIAVQDGAELLPTFNWPAENVQFVIAGGTPALLRAVEGAEDDSADARTQLAALSPNRYDICIGVAASGITAFTVAAIEAAREAGAMTIGVANNPKTPLLTAAEFPILLDTGAEVLAGSTRLKAGTAQKICLNLISTQIMVMLGYVKDGLMSEMVPLNEKLRRRRAEIDALLGRD